MPWKITAAILFCALYGVDTQAAEIAFSSRQDFTAINLQLKNQHNPGAITLNVELSPAAQARLASASREALHQNLTLIIDGKKVSTPKVQAVLDTRQLQISLSRETTQDLLPSLLPR
ncbi:hypothetical protein [Andreprevotia chitinilytica]|uniref:hypothetical protein n=1 Tax=Andreprevotia chitinilytica TaxID=396808 RepID=UPI0012EB2E66|nr:hypothetical protein [Andreprevotia chitinilytica]